MLSAIGQYLDSDSSKYYGYINEFRISDVARWTSNFTPPTEPYVIESESPIDPYTWYESDAPTPVQMTQYIANVEALKEVLTLANNAPELPPDMDGLTIQEANYMEEILAMINLYLLALQRVFLRSEMPWAVSGGPGFYFEN